MTKLRLVTYSELRKVAESCGFEWQRRQGSHNTFRNPEGRIIVIPDHGGRLSCALCYARYCGIWVSMWMSTIKSWKNSRIHKAGGHGEVWEVIHGNKQEMTIVGLPRCRA